MAIDGDGDGSATISNLPTVRRHEDMTRLAVVAPPAQIVAPIMAANPTITAMAGSEMAISNTPDLPALAPIIPPPNLPPLGPQFPLFSMTMCPWTSTQ